MKKVIMGTTRFVRAKLGRSQVIAAYPITPQTQVVELLSEMCADGSLKAKFIKVESEHSAMAACIGASLAGARTFTATSAQGLALMHEMLHWASGGGCLSSWATSTGPWRRLVDLDRPERQPVRARHGLDAVLLLVEPGGPGHGHPGLQGVGGPLHPEHGHPGRLRAVSYL